MQKRINRDPAEFSMCDARPHVSFNGKNFPVLSSEEIHDLCNSPTFGDDLDLVVAQLNAYGIQVVKDVEKNLFRLLKAKNTGQLFLPDSHKATFENMKLGRWLPSVALAYMANWV
jgi:hypothetical protein